MTSCLLIRSRHRLPPLALLAALPLFATGCGKPPAGPGGPPGDFPVSAVVAEATAETLDQTVSLVGSLRARDSLDVVSELNAPVEAILFDDGDTVTAGQPLVRLDDSKLKAREAEAAARFALARLTYERNQALLANQTISQQEYDQARADYDAAEASLTLLRREREDAVITAPLDGVVGERAISVGQYLSVGTPVTRLVCLDPLEVGFQVPERYVGQLAPGEPIVMTTVAYPDRVITGEVFFLDNRLDESSRTLLAKAMIPNPDGSLKPGLFGTLTLIVNQREGAVVIPESAVRYNGDQAGVVVMNGEGKAEFRDVEVGERLPGRLEITRGLAAGERVVVEGFQKMGPGTTVLISPDSARYGLEPTPPPADS